MANITENTQNPAWSNGIYQIETSDPVLGGANGIANRQAKELAARTQWLRTELSKAISSIGTNKSSTDSAIALKANHATQITAGAGLTGGGNLSANRTIALATPSTLSGSTTNWVGNGATGHTHEIAKATPTVAGVVKLVNALNSTATDAALTAAQGKALSDRIAAAISGSLNMRGELVAQNLNDLNDTAHYGVWRNANNVNATKERNYPISRAGTLLVLPSAYKGQQIYFPFDDKGIYIRDTRNSNNPPTWSDWYKISSDDRVAKSGDTMTGLLSINTGNWARMQFGTNDGNWKMEFDPKGAASRQMNFNFNDTTGERTFIRFPVLEKGVNQVVAYQSWVNEQNPKNRSGIDLDTATAPQFFINAKSGYVSAVGVEHAGLILGYQNDCTQIITAGGNMWVRGSDANPISKPEDWSEWKRILDEKNGVLKSQISNAIDSNSNETVASSRAVKTVYDKAEQSAPSGMIAYFSQSTAPAGWLKCNGAVVSRSTYAGIFAAIGTTYGAGNGSTTFKLPDLRGEFIRVWDDGRNVDTGRKVGSSQGDAIRNIAGRFNAYRRSDRNTMVMPTGVFSMVERVNGAMGAGNADDWAMTIDFSADKVVPTANENRPRNVALLACIKI